MSIYPRPEEILIYGGIYFTAEWYYTQEGAIPAYEYYQRLDDLDRRSFFGVMKYFCDNKPGMHLPKTIYRIEDPDNKIYAFKARSERFFNFTSAEATVIVTNAYRKHSQQMTKQDRDELRKAVKFREDFLTRMKEGIYYEK